MESKCLNKKCKEKLSSYGKYGYQFADTLLCSGINYFETIGMIYRCTNKYCFMKTFHTNKDGKLIRGWYNGDIDEK